MVAKTLERRYNVATAFLLVVREIGCIAVRCSSAGRRFYFYCCENKSQISLSGRCQRFHLLKCRLYYLTYPK